MLRALGALALVIAIVGAAPSAGQIPTYRIDHVTDGDTVVLRNGQRVRLVHLRGVSRLNPVP